MWTWVMGGAGALLPGPHSRCYRKRQDSEEAARIVIGNQTALLDEKR